MLDKVSLASEAWEQANLKGLGEVVRWASQLLNIEIGLALRSEDRWVGADYQEQATDKNLTLDELLARSQAVVIGIDGGGLDELLGLAVLGRAEKDRQLMLWSKVVLERRKGEASVLRDFEAAIVEAQALKPDIADDMEKLGIRLQKLR